MLRYLKCAVVAAVLTVSGVFLASPALAHTDLGISSPLQDELVPETPKEIVLNFTNPVDPQRFSAELLFRDGTPVVLSGQGPVFSDDNKTVTLTPPAMERGTYALVWKSVDASGHLSVGQLVFSVQSVSGIDIGSGDLSSFVAAVPGTLIRYSSFIAAALLLGWWFTVRFARRKSIQGETEGRAPPTEAPPDGAPQEDAAPAVWVRRAARVRVAAALTLAVTLLLKPVIALAAVASVGALSAESVTTMLTDMPNALGWWLTLVAIATCLASLRATVAAPVAVAAAVLADALASHLAPLPLGPALVPLLIVHIVGFLMWVGLPLAWMVIRPEPGWRPFLSMFTLPAVVSAGAVMVSGPLLWLLRTGSPDEMAASLSGLYGQVAASKLALVLLILVPLGLVHVAFAVRRRVAVVVAREKGAEVNSLQLPYLQRPRRLVTVEVTTMLVALLAGSLLVGLVPTSRAQLSSSGDVLAVAGSWDECVQGNIGQEEQFLCLVKYIDKTVREDSPGKVLRILNEKTDSGDTFALHNCHELSHKIGRAAWIKYKDLGTALQQGQDNCDFGYMHGIIEGFALGVPDDALVPSLAQECDTLPFDRADHQVGQCYHGIGHAIGRRVNLDMPKAFDMCTFFNDPARVAARSFEAEQEFVACGTGAIMEWTLRPGYQKEISLPIGAPGTTLELCSGLDEIFHEACFEYVTSPLGPDPDKLLSVRDWCYENLSDFSACFKSIGRDMMWGSFTNSAVISEKDAIDACYYGDNQEAIDGCLRWALGSIVTVYHAIEPLDRACQFLDPERQRTLCPDVRESMLKALAANQRGEDSVVVDG